SSNYRSRLEGWTVGRLEGWTVGRLEGTANEMVRRFLFPRCDLLVTAGQPHLQSLSHDAIREARCVAVLSRTLYRDLSDYLALSQERALRPYLPDATRCVLGCGEHRGRISQTRPKGVSSFSGHSFGFPCRDRLCHSCVDGSRAA